MILYGRNLRDIVDAKLAQDYLDTEIVDLFANTTYVDIVRQSQAAISLARRTRDDNYDRYVIISTENFDIDKYTDDFEVGDTVAYYCGDRSGVNKKLRRRFTGPWTIIARVPNRSNVVTITNPENGDTLSVHVKMLKRYYKEQFIPYSEMLRQEKEAMQRELIAEHKLREELKANSEQ